MSYLINLVRTWNIWSRIQILFQLILLTHFFLTLIHFKTLELILSDTFYLAIFYLSGILTYTYKVTAHIWYFSFLNIIILCFTVYFLRIIHIIIWRTESHLRIDLLIIIVSFTLPRIALNNFIKSYRLLKYTFKSSQLLKFIFLFKFFMTSFGLVLQN